MSTENKTNEINSIPSIAIVSSFRKFLSEVAMARKTFVRHGILVTNPPSLTPINPGADYVRFPEDDPTLSDVEIQKLTIERIMSATAVYALCVGGYTGPLTSYEIGRASEARRPVYFSEMPAEPFMRTDAEDRIVTPNTLAAMILQRTITPITPIAF